MSTGVCECAGWLLTSELRYSLTERAGVGAVLCVRCSVLLESWVRQHRFT